MKIVKILIITVLIFNLGVVKSQNPETVHSIVKVYKPHKWYIEQAEAWWKVLENEKINEDAWYNYFKANRMAQKTFEPGNGDVGNWIKESKALKTGEDIIKLIDKYIPNTFTCHYVKWYQKSPNPALIKELRKANEIDPSRPEVYDGFVTYYETQFDREKRKQYNLSWHKLNDIAVGLLAYNYNTLVSLEKNAILITNGDNDTYPAWMLQDALNIRPDVEVLNIHILKQKLYREKVFDKLNIPQISDENSNDDIYPDLNKLVEHIVNNAPDNIPVYFGMTVRQEYYKSIADKLYLVGVAFRYSDENIENLAYIKRNFEKEYLLDYLKVDLNHDISRQLIYYLNVNYLPGIIKLYEFYKQGGDVDEMNKIKLLGNTIAKNAGEEWQFKLQAIFSE